MFDFASMYPGMKQPEPKTPQDLHNTCAWCRTNPAQVNAYECLCLHDCGRPFCAQAADLTEFQSPGLPRFL